MMSNMRGDEMAAKRPTQKCGQCARIDRESYKGAKVLACYHIAEDKTARTVTERTDACGYFRQV